MKILHIIPSYKPAFVYGGPIISVADLCENQARFEQVTVFTTNGHGSGHLSVPTSERVIINQVNVYYFASLIPRNIHLCFRLLQKLWRSASDFDVIHLHSWWNLTAILSALVLLLLNRKLVISPRGMLNETLSEKTIWRRLFHQLIGRKLLSKAVLHFTSTEERATVVSSLSNRPSFILPNLITLPAISCIAPPSDPCKFTIVYLGRLHPQKNLESLLAALSSLSWVDCCLIVGVGEIDYEGRLRKVAIDRGIDDKVRWLGWADEATKFTLLGQVDLMVLPSFSESYANVVVESLAMGTAVLTTDRVGLANYITEKQFGWVVPPTAEGLAQGITQAYADSARRAYVRREAPKRVRYDFDQTRLTQYYLAAYRDHLGL